MDASRLISRGRGKGTNAGRRVRFYRFTVKSENFNAQLRGQIGPGRSSFAAAVFHGATDVDGKRRSISSGPRLAGKFRFHFDVP